MCFTIMRRRRATTTNRNLRGSGRRLDVSIGHRWCHNWATFSRSVTWIHKTVLFALNFLFFKIIFCFSSSVGKDGIFVECLLCNGRMSIFVSARSSLHCGFNNAGDDQDDLHNQLPICAKCTGTANKNKTAKYFPFLILRLALNVFV